MLRIMRLKLIVQNGTPLFGNGITIIGCMAHARRKFYNLHEANKSELADKALDYIGGLCENEREAKDLLLPSPRIGPLKTVESGMIEP